MSALQLDQLRRRAYDETGPLPPVELRPGDAVGHMLREDLHALRDLPPAEIATAAGWAVAGPGPWQVMTSQTAATASAGHGDLPDGYALEVEVNGTLPQGTTAVVNGETGRVVDGRLSARAALGDHVLPRGAECAAGALLVPEGTLLTPGAAALAAAGGHPDVRVTGHPTVALLLAHGSAAPAGGVDVPAALLTGMLRATDAADVGVRRVPDSGIALRSTLDAVRADVVVVAGDLTDARPDRLASVLADSRADIALDGAVDAEGLVGASSWLMARLRDGRVLVALPGDPRSAAAGLLTLVRPALRAMAGFGFEELDTRVLDAPLRGDERGTSFVFLRGTAPTPDHGPTTGHGVAGSDAVAVTPPLGIPVGGTVDVLPM